MDFQVGSIFTSEAYDAAVAWCADHPQFYIKPLETLVDGKHQFQIFPITALIPSGMLFKRLRESRNARLSETDYAVLPDYPLSDEKKQALYAYRQQLRDITSLEGAPWDGGYDSTPWPINPLEA